MAIEHLDLKRQLDGNVDELFDASVAVKLVALRSLDNTSADPMVELRGRHLNDCGARSEVVSLPLSLVI